MSPILESNQFFAHVNGFWNEGHRRLFMHINQIQLIVNHKKSEILTVFIEFSEKPLSANVRLVIVWFDVYLFLKPFVNGLPISFSKNRQVYDFESSILTASVVFLILKVP